MGLYSQLRKVAPLAEQGKPGVRKKATLDTEVPVWRLESRTAARGAPRELAVVMPTMCRTEDAVPVVD